MKIEARALSVQSTSRLGVLWGVHICMCTGLSVRLNLLRKKGKGYYEGLGVQMRFAPAVFVKGF